MSGCVLKRMSAWRILGSPTTAEDSVVQKVLTMSTKERQRLQIIARLEGCVESCTQGRRLQESGSLNTAAVDLI
jgi:hypothetical protein